MKLRMIAIVLMLPIMINLLVFSSSDIIVEAQTIRVTGVTFDMHTITMDKLGTTQRLNATILPAQATDRRVEFSSSNTEVATVNEWGDVTAISNGISHITVTTTDGGFTATSLVTVESFFIDRFVVTIDGVEGLIANMWEGDTKDVYVEVYPAQSILQDVPFINNNNPSIVSIGTFERINLQRNANTTTFRTTVTALRQRGTADVRISLIERSTESQHSHDLTFNVANAQDGMSLEFRGLHFDETNPLVTASSEIPLRLGMLPPGAPEPFFNIVSDPMLDNENLENEYNEENPIGYIRTENDGTKTLVFNEANTIFLHLGAGDYYTIVKITSTFHQINFNELENTLRPISEIDMLYRQTHQITFNINPFDFTEFYESRWIPSAGITIQMSSPTDILVTATAVLSEQYVYLELRQLATGELEDFRFNINVSNFGVNEIQFELSNDETLLRGLEQIYVFGNMNLVGEDFEFQMRFVTQGPTNAVESFNFTSSNENIATVNNNGLVTFRSNFDGFDENGRAYVTITATSFYATMTNPNEFATDAFTFAVVRGANVENFAQYAAANNNGLDIVLRNSITFEVGILTHGSLHGNGYTMDASIAANNINLPTTTIFTFAGSTDPLNRTLISNVVFSGFGDDDIVALSTRGTLVTINANTTLQYSILERAAILLEIRTNNGAEANVDVHVYSNLFSFAGFAGAFLGGTSGGGLSANVIFEDLIFENGLIGIIFEPEDGIRSTRCEFNFTIKGDMRFYNWHTLENFLDLTIIFLGLSISMDSFDMEDVHIMEIDGVEYIQLAIVILELTDSNATSFRWRTTAVFNSESGTADRLGEIISRLGDNPARIPSDGSDYSVGVSRGAYISMPLIGSIGRPILSIHNPKVDSRDFVSPLDQLAHFINPDRSLITRQIN